VVIVTVTLDSQIGQIKVGRIRTELTVEICTMYDWCIAAAASSSDS